MRKVVLTFGIIAGLIVSAMMFITFTDGITDIEHGELIGYTTMVIAFSTIFFAIKSYRDKYQDGSITFGKAFRVGLYIALVASTMYVASWMVISYTYGKDFMDEYYKASIEKLEESDLPQEEIDIQIANIESMKEWYKNPLFRVAVTYIEILPVGLLISLICAAILRKKKVIPQEAQ